MAGARGSERDFAAGLSRRRLLSDQEEHPLLQGELRDDRLPRASALAPLPSVISPRPPLPLRRVDLPLPIPPVRSAALRPRTHVLGSRDARRFGRLDDRRRLLDQRRVSVDHRSDDRFRNRVFARSIQGPGGSFLGRAGTCKRRIVVVPQRSRYIRCSRRRFGSCVSSCLIWRNTQNQFLLR